MEIRDSEYKKLLRHILKEGVRKEDRTGVGTISMFGYQCRFNLQKGFPIVTEKKTAFKAAITELIWMIGGWMKEERYQGLTRTNIRFLLDNNCKIWTEWPYKAYVNTLKDGRDKLISNNPTATFPPLEILSQQEYEQRIIDNIEFAKAFGDLGPVYQKQWRDFEGKKDHVDQLLTMIKRLETNPDCRRNLSSYWNPTELSEMLLPPCHLLHQVWTRELTVEERGAIDANIKGTRDTTGQQLATFGNEVKTWLDEAGIPKRAISLQMYQRSSDSFLGVPFDWVWYAAFTHILADLTNMVVGDFIWVSGDTHLYLNSLNETHQVLESETFDFPKFNIKRKVEHIEDYKIEDFELIGYKSGPAIRVAVAV